MAYQRLVQAIIEGDELCVQKFLETNQRLEKTNDLTPLMIAAINQQYNIVNMLLSHGVDINERDYNGNTVIMHLCGRSSTKLIEFLLKHGADVNAVNNANEMVISVACRSKCWDVVELLIKWGADVNAIDRFKVPLLMNVYRWGHGRIMRMIIEHPDIQLNIRGKCNKTLLIFAFQDEGIIQDLLMANADVNIIDDNGNSVLSLACKYSSYDIIKLLLSYGAVGPIESIVYNICSNTTLLNNERHCIIKSLLETEFVGNKDKALIQACKYGAHALIKLLLQHGANPNYEHQIDISPLSCAVKDEYIFECLLQYGAKVNIYNITEYVFRCDHERILTLAVKHGFDINEKNKRGQNIPMMVARGYPNYVWHCLQYDLNLNAQDIQGQTLLMYLINSAENNYNLIKQILIHGADVNIQDNDGSTALILALDIETRNRGISLLLLQYGADVNKRTNDRDHALSIYIYAYCDHPDFVQPLLFELLKKSKFIEERLALLPGDHNVLQLLIRRGINIKKLMRYHRSEYGYLCNIEHSMTLASRAASVISEDTLKKAVNNNIISNEIVNKYREIS